MSQRVTVAAGGTASSASSAPAAGRKRKLRVWEVIALSVGFMGPVLAMSLNGVGVAGLVGKAVPFTFVLAFLGTLFVGYGFIRLTGYFSHAGSVYALAGSTIGPRAGFFGGFALLGTYLFFAACTLAATAVFFQAWGREFGADWTGLSWILVPAVVAVFLIVLNVRESRVVTRVLLGIGGVGVLAMLVLAVVIFVRVGTGTGPVASATVDWTVFLPGNAPTVAILTASVFAFLSWAGFESGTSLGEETENPKKAIPRALLGAVLLAGALYTIMMFAQTIGYGTDEAGIAAFAGANSTLTDLGTMYIGQGFSLVIAFIAFVVAFASTLSSTAAASRLVYALARDGFGPRALGVVNERTRVPVRAVWTTVIIAFLLALGLFLFQVSAFDAYYWYATIATLCMVVAYGMTSIGVIVFVLRGKRRIPKWEIVLPVLGLTYLAFVYSTQVIGQEAPYSYFPWISGAWCLIGLAIILAYPKLAQRIGNRLTAEDID